MKELITLEGVSKYYSLGERRKTKALCDVSLRINRGETVGLVGESGSGKSTLARIVMGIEQPDSGQVFCEGKLISTRRSLKERIAQAKKSQIIFQDSLASLNPRMTVESIISEGMEIHKMFDQEGRRARTLELLKMVGLEEGHSGRYPHEFSGGQRQRIGIARALAVNPEFIVCDEPISALDISVQSHIMNLLMDLKKSFGLTFLFIAHDLNMVNYISDRIAVMYLGRIVELGKKDEVCLHPRHPYTKFLLNAILIPDPSRKSLGKTDERNGGSFESNSLSGCDFAELCPFTPSKCKWEVPKLNEAEKGHFSACHFSG